MIRAIRRLGIPEKIINMIKAIYLAPNYIITEKDVTTTPRIQKNWNHTRMPTVTLPFYNVDDRRHAQCRNLINRTRKLETTHRDRLHKQMNGKPFYADDTIIMAKTAKPVEIILHKIEVESSRYSLKLNQNRCIHIQMNAI